MIGSLSLLAASSPESLWKGWRYGECKKWKRLDSQMGRLGNLTRHGSYILQGASLVMQRWSDNLHLLGQSKTEMASQEFRVRFKFIEINEFSERYPTTKSKTSKSTKENREPKDGKGEKDTQDGNCCLWGLDPFDPSGLFGLFGPFVKNRFLRCSSLL